MDIPTELAELDRWVVWKYECKPSSKPAKVPFNAKTDRHASVSKDEDWCDLGTAMKAYKERGYSGIGFVFVAEDDICGVDIDECRSSNGQLSDEACTILAKLRSYCEVSPSGRGVKVFCRGRIPLSSGRKCKIDHEQRLELYTSGRYFTFTGQAIKKCPKLLSEASDALAELVAQYVDTKVVQPEISAGVKPANAAARAASYAKTMSPSISGQRGHDLCFHFCCRMLNGFDLSVEEFWPILNDWNARCEPPWSERELEHKIEEAIAIGKQEQRGYMYVDDLQTVGTGVAEFHDWFKQDDQQWLEKHRFPSHLLPHTGLLADICQYINSHAFRTQPVLAMSAAISLMSLALSRKVCDDQNTFTNTYIINLAATGEGKNNPQMQVLKLIESVDFDLINHVGDEVTSDTAIENDLYRHGSMLYLKDEYGSEWRGQSKAPWLHSVNTILMKLWGKADSSHRCKTKSSDSKPRLIQKPCLSLSGWTTPGMFWPTVMSDHLTDGFLARLLLFDVTDTRSQLNKNQTNPPIPTELTERLRYWFNYQGETQFDPDKPGAFVPLRIERTAKATELMQDAMQEMTKYEDSEMEFGIWKRMPEKAARLAIISAASRVDYASDLLINEDDAAWGCAVASWCSASLISRTKQFGGGETTRERQIDRVLQCIRSAFLRKQNLPRAELRKLTRGIPTRDFDDIISQLTEMDLIVVQQIAGKGRPKQIYRPVVKA